MRYIIAMILVSGSLFLLGCDIPVVNGYYHFDASVYDFKNATTGKFTGPVANQEMKLCVDMQYYSNCSGSGLKEAHGCNAIATDSNAHFTHTFHVETSDAHCYGDPEIVDVNFYILVGPEGSEDVYQIDYADISPCKYHNKDPLESIGIGNDSDDCHYNIETNFFRDFI